MKNDKLGESLKARRQEKGLTLAELEAVSGVDKTYLGRIERGGRFPSAATLQKLAGPLGYEETELLKLAGYLSYDECKIPQEDADHILAVGHKVTYQGKECVITSIRVWHDMGTLLGRPFRGKPVFDLKGEGWATQNTPIDDLDLWFPPVPMPTATVVPPGEVESDDKGRKRAKQGRAGPPTKESG